MADANWKGGAPAVTQVSSATVTAYDAATTYKLTVAGLTVSAVGNTDVNTTAEDLKTAWNASTYPYFTAALATRSGAAVILTANVAGVPFTVTSSVTGGTGTIGAVAAVTACTGPNHWSNAKNWIAGSFPITNDDIFVANSSHSILWEIEESLATSGKMRIDDTFTGRIGLNPAEFATSASSSTPTAPEYRPTYLKLGAARIDIGQQNTPGGGSGSDRIKIHNTITTAALINVWDSAASIDSNLPAVRLKTDDADVDLNVYGGSVGLGVESSIEVCVIGDVYVGVGAAHSLQLGAKVTMGTYVQDGGANNIIRATDATTVTAATFRSGTATIYGDFVVTTMTVSGDAIVYDAHIRSGGVAATTVALNGGTLDTTRSNEARTYTTVNQAIGAIFEYDSAVLSITTYNRPTGRVNLTASAL